MKFSTLKKIALLVILAIGTLSAQAQDVVFSQFYASSLYLNPAFAGMETNLTVNTNYRSQWRTANSPFLTTQISGILPFYGGVDGKRQFGGAGVSVYNDQSGDGAYRTLGTVATLAYTLDLELHKFSFGLQGGVGQIALDIQSQQWGGGYDNSRYTYNTLYTTSQDANLANLTNSKSYGIVNGGAMYSFNPGRSYYKSSISGHVGISAYNINRPNVSLTSTSSDAGKIPMRTNIYGGLNFLVNESISLSPAAQYVTQGDFKHTNLGLYLNYKLFDRPIGLLAETDLILGGWYRSQDGAVAMLGFANQAYTLGFSYDFPGTSSYNSVLSNKGACEVSLALHFVKERRRKRFDTPRI
jgi:type IX secretion system PorP/SprF family membrane protein